MVLLEPGLHRAAFFVESGRLLRTRRLLARDAVANAAVPQSTVASRRPLASWYSNQSGVYMWTGGVLSVIADRDTLIPGTSQTFGIFNDSSAQVADIQNGEVVFNNDGIYVWRGSGLETVADFGTPIPGSIAMLPFTAFGAPAIDSGSVTFQGSNVFEFPPFTSVLLKTGVYTNVNGFLQSVASRSLFGRIDGKVVETLRSGKESTQDGIYAFKATFFDGSQGIFLTAPL